jgi:alkylhydroperoxidase family enzyme
MRLAKPRVEPVSQEEYRALYQALFGETLPDDTPVLNVARTFARHPALMKARRPQQQHLNTNPTIPMRHHELVVLRIGWLCQAEYEFSQHTLFGKRAGLTDAEITRIIEGPNAPGWTPFEATLLRTVDELYRDNFIADATWTALTEHYDAAQIMDLIVLVGQYWTVSVFLNATGVQLEEGKPRFPR